MAKLNAALARPACRNALLAGAAALLISTSVNFIVPRSDHSALDMAGTILISHPWSAVDQSATLPPDFLGNPNAYYSSINTSAGISFSRDGDTLLTPAAVHVSIKDIAADAIAGVLNRTNGVIKHTDGTILDKLYAVPYEDWEVGWDFGDPDGTETFVNPGQGRINATGATVNANNRQWAPEAAYIYRTPGDYTITCTIRAKFAADSYVTVSATRTVTVYAISDTSVNPTYVAYYMDPDSGNDANDGLAPVQGPGTEGPKKIQIPAAFREASGHALYIKRGCTTVIPATLDWPGSVGRARIDTYSIDGGGNPIFPGVGSKPIWERGGGGSTIACRNLDGNHDDFVISNQDFRRTSASTSGACITVDGNDAFFHNNWYIDRCDFTLADGAAFGTGCLTFSYHADLAAAKENKTGIWGCTFTAPLNAPNALSLVGGGGGRRWAFLVGGSFIGRGNSTSMDHHIYPPPIQNSLIKWVEFKDAPNKANAINGNFDGVAPYTSITYAEYHIISECSFTKGDFAATDFGSGGGALGWFRNVVMERCRVSDYTSSNVSGFTWHESSISITFRDLECWKLPGLIYKTGSAGVLLVPKGPGEDGIFSPTPQAPPWTTNTSPGVPIWKCYRLKLHRAAGTVVFNMLSLGGLQQWTDNEVVDLRVGSNTLLSFSSNAQGPTLGGLMDRNNYWAPNVTAPFFNTVSSTNLTLAQVKALAAGYLEPNSTQVNPNWVDAANGDFSVP